MADDTSTSTTDTDPAARADDTTEQQAGKPDVPPEFKRALTKANKEAETLRLKLKEYEDRDKTDLERLTAAQQEAEQRAQAADLRATRLEVAAENNLTVAQAKRLVGTTREELQADAQEILRDFPVASAGAPRPKPDPSQGSRGAPAVSGRDAGLAEAQKRFGKTPTT